MQNYELLIANVKNIIDKNHRKQNEDNIFKILGLSRSEMVYSKILYKLLISYRINNKNKFLELFLKRVLKISENVVAKNYKVVREFYLGENSRIDLYIKNNQRAYGIEIKIDATDSQDQLNNYNKYLEKIHGSDNYDLFYLTLDGKEADCVSASRNLVYTRISFSSDILMWLNECVNVAENDEQIDLINQFLKLLENAKEEKEMSDIKKFLREGNNLELAVILSKQIDEVKREKESNFIKKLKKEIIEKLDVNEDILEKFKKSNISSLKNKYILYFYKEYKEKLFCYGIESVFNGNILFFAGIDEKNEEKWITKKTIKNNSELVEKINLIFEGPYDKPYDKQDFFSQNLEFYSIDLERFYYFDDEENKKMIEETIEFFREKQALIDKYI